MLNQVVLIPNRNLYEQRNGGIYAIKLFVCHWTSISMQGKICSYGKITATSHFSLQLLFTGAVIYKFFNRPAPERATAEVASSKVVE